MLQLISWLLYEKNLSTTPTTKYVKIQGKQQMQ